MRASTAYFAGAGTVIAAIVGGIGGGLLFADIVSPKTPKAEMTRLEQRMSAQPIQVKAGAEPAASPSTPPTSTTAVAPAASAPESSPAQNAAAPAAPSSTPTTVAAPVPAPERPQQQNANSTPATAPTAETVAVTQQSATAASFELKASELKASEPKTSPPAQKQVATAPEDSLAKARDADVKRAATEKRRTERRQQWSEKRRYQRRDDPDQELREVEAKVREETETRPVLASEPARSETPRIRLFDLD